jgi:hypothetical protein
MNNFCFSLRWVRIIYFFFIFYIQSIKLTFVIGACDFHVYF